MTSSPTPQTPLEIHYQPQIALLIYYHLICTSLLPGYVTQDVYMKENAGQDHLGNFSAPAVNTLT